MSCKIQDILPSFLLHHLQTWCILQTSHILNFQQPHVVPEDPTDLIIPNSHPELIKVTEANKRAVGSE